MTPRAVGRYGQEPVNSCPTCVPPWNSEVKDHGLDLFHVSTSDPSFVHSSSVKIFPLPSARACCRISAKWNMIWFVQDSLSIAQE